MQPDSDPKPINYFTDDAPGESLQSSVENEKLKLLRLIAEKGTEGQVIYDEARRRSSQAQADAKKASTAGNARVSAAAIAEVSREQDEALRVVNQIREDSARAAKEDNVRRRSIEAIYKDSVAGDATLAASAQERIDLFEQQQALAARGGGGGGGGRGGGGRGGGGQGSTVPVDLIEAIDKTVFALDDGAYFGAEAAKAPRPPRPPSPVSGYGSQYSDQQTNSRPTPARGAASNNGRGKTPKQPNPRRSGYDTTSRYSAPGRQGPR